ncbi:MAG: hypothetical protein M1831_006085 [Alyxoria varia]|nr:MAG: hypothetical protein M1831_006085 [Alyxoria varia]
MSTTTFEPPANHITHAQSHHAIRAHQRHTYHTSVTSGAITPLTYPSGTYHIGIVLLFLLIPPSSRLHCRATRYATFALVAGWHFYLVTNVRALNEAAGFLWGIASAWAVLWVFCLCVVRDGKVEFARVHAEVGEGRERVGGVQGVRDGRAVDGKGSAADVSRGAGVRRCGGSGDGSEMQQDFAPRDPRSFDEADGKRVKYYWQPYPANSPLSARMNWTWDLFSTFRGPHWNWRIPTLPSLPPHVQRQLSSSSPADDSSHPNTSTSSSLQPPGNSQPNDIKDVPVSRTGVRRFNTRATCIRHNLRLLLIGYLILDLLITLSHHDPYFRVGNSMQQTAPSYFPTLIGESALLIRAYRLLFSMTLIWIALRTVFCLEPLFFVGVLGPLVDRGTVGGQWYVRSRAWAHPEYWGGWGMVMERGLAGWWGGWWHQAFRVGFEEGSGFLVERVCAVAEFFVGKFWGVGGGGRNVRWRESSPREKEDANGGTGKKLGSDGGRKEEDVDDQERDRWTVSPETRKFLSVFAAFSLSGFIHASGSAMMNGDGRSHPLSGSFQFFFLQAVGVLLEQGLRATFSKYLKGRDGDRSVPPWMRRLANFTFAHTWMFVTGSLFADDLARGGLWLYEPVVLSPARALGIGVKGDAAFCWGDLWVGWWSGGKFWWLGGIAF